MKAKRFLVSSLVLAGILPADQSRATLPNSALNGPDPDDDEMVRKFAQDHRFILAQHRSHSSHASHGSHRSGSSGRVRTPVYTPPAPRTPRTTPTPAPAPSRNERSTPPSSILPSSPEIAPGSQYSAPSQSEVQQIVRRVQIALMAYGYYDGTIDGMVGPKTRAALKRFQTDFSLNVTGTVTPQVLDALKISTQ